MPSRAEMVFSKGREGSCALDRLSSCRAKGGADDSVIVPDLMFDGIALTECPDAIVVGRRDPWTYKRVQVYL